MKKNGRKFHRNFLVNLTIVLAAALDVPAGGVEFGEDGCPSFCTCYTWYHLRWASCSGRHLYSTHTGVSDAVQALDLSNNSISILADFELQRMGLRQLRYLNLSDNAISEVGLSAFAGLVDLTVLDLSRNHLNYVLPRTLADNVNLRVLRLAGNNFDQHVPFLESSSITELNLASCRLSHVSRGAFGGLRQLRNLDLSDNLMIQLEASTIRVLPFLRILSLKNNPWTCGTREMQELQTYVTTRSIRCEPTVCPRKPHRKLERIIMGTARGEPPGAVVLPKNRRNGSAGWEKAEVNNNVTAVPEDAMVDSEKLITSSVGWFLCSMGFITGLAVGTVSTYLWLSYSLWFRRLGTLLGGRRGGSTSSEYLHPSAQRVSLLRNIWNNSDEEITGLRRIPVCPGTPPPPYHDVIFHANRYPVR